MNKNFSASPLAEVRKNLSRALKQFLESERRVQIVHSTSQQSRITSPTKSLYVLDSSFNPPSLAHFQLAKTALTEDDGAYPRRLLLLLATTNADKASKLDTFEDRMVMMHQFAEQLRRETAEDSKAEQNSEQSAEVDVGLTKEPYFINKAMAIDDAKIYPDEPQQIHLTGFDTFTRIFDAKYYAPDHTLNCLEPFLRKHRLRVTYRPDDEWGDRATQEQYIRDIAEGKREAEGGKREWANHIRMVEGKAKGEEPISSTRARKAAKQEDWDGLKTLVPSSVFTVIHTEHLYANQ
ncbi:putative cytidylyltransferase family protein [Phaeomoniella chlamydospora]|uniref:Putative cytidylyltransferase family protein n=1 Tax=Phaeomoniella chlamydospora TaxID=158046 RepID=A0A0G2GXR0_PHACM|nr:putative cytidylyltransferase family protein [Phaeomoniella chlamydospora]